MRAPSRTQLKSIRSRADTLRGRARANNGRCKDTEKSRQMMVRSSHQRDLELFCDSCRSWPYLHTPTGGCGHLLCMQCSCRKLNVLLCRCSCDTSSSLWFPHFPPFLHLYSKTLSWMNEWAGTRWNKTSQWRCHLYPRRPHAFPSPARPRRSILAEIIGSA